MLKNLLTKLLTIIPILKIKLNKEKMLNNTNLNLNINKKFINYFFKLLISF